MQRQAKGPTCYKLFLPIYKRYRYTICAPGGLIAIVRRVLRESYILCHQAAGRVGLQSHCGKNVAVY